MIPPPPSLRRGDGLTVQPVYYGKSSLNFIRSVESRLVRAKILLGRRQAEIELDRAIRTESVLFGTLPAKYVAEERKAQLDKDRSSYEGALYANTSFARLLNREANGQEVIKLIGEGWGISLSGVREFQMADAIWFSEGGKGEVYSIDDITFPEDMFYGRK